MASVPVLGDEITLDGKIHLDGKYSIRDLLGILKSQRARSNELPSDIPSKLWVKLEGVSAPKLADSALMWMMPLLRRLICLPGSQGRSRATAIALPKQVHPESWDTVLEWAAFHRASGRSDSGALLAAHVRREKKLFDEKLIRQQNVGQLCGLAAASDALELQSLVDISSRGIARQMAGKSPEEIRALFGLPDDLTEEEKLETFLHPMLAEGGMTSQRQRMLQRLYAKRLEELRANKAGPEVEPAPEAPKKEDPRSVEELLEFIGEGGGDGRKGKKKKKKKGKGNAAKGSEAGGGDDGDADADGGGEGGEAAGNGGVGGRAREGEGEEGYDSPEESSTGMSRAGSRVVNSRLVGLPRGDLVRMLREGEVSESELDELFAESSGEASGEEEAGDGMGDGDFDLEMELFEQRLQSGLDEHIQALMEASYLASCKGAPQGS